MPTQALRVFINGRFFSQQVSGVQRYARETLNSLDVLLSEGEGEGLRWILLVPKGLSALPVFRCIEVEEIGWFSGHLWEQLELPWCARTGVLFSFGLTGPLAQRSQIITVHDANVIRIPEAYSWQFRMWYRFLVRYLVAHSVQTVVVSRFAATEAAACYGAKPERLRIAMEGWQHLLEVEPDERILDRAGLRDQTFALAVSSPTANKNFNAIVQALSLMGDEAPPCAVAGGGNHVVFSTENLSASSAMIPLGYVSDAELKALYKNATCFIFPSFYEGFGIPPLEAMSCGCPVIASTAAAVSEVCGDAPLYFDPHQPAQLADCLRKVFSDSSLRKSMSARGIERSRHYSWSEGARLNLSFIREALCTT